MSQIGQNATSAMLYGTEADSIMMNGTKVYTKPSATTTPLYMVSSVNWTISSPNTWTMPSHAANDLIVVQVLNENGGSNTINDPNNYTPISQTNSANTTIAAFYKVATSSSEPVEAITTTLTNDVLGVAIHIFRGVNTLTPIESVVTDACQDNNVVHDIPAMTATNDNSLAVALIMVGDNRTIAPGGDATNYTRQTPDAGYKTTSGADGAWLLMYTQAVNAGSVAADSVDFDQSEDGGTIDFILIPA